MTQRERPSQRREREPDSRVSVQFLFIPNRHQPEYASSLVQAAGEVFGQDEGARHIIALQAPIHLVALNLPHFNRWVQNTGSYFDGFLQHCVTSPDDKTPPLSAEKLAEERTLYQGLIDTNFRDVSRILEQTEEAKRDFAREEVYMLTSLLLLDQLPSSLKTELRIQPFSGIDFAKLVLQSRGLEKLPEEGDMETDDVDVYLASSKEGVEKYLRINAKTEGERIRPYSRFVGSLIDEAIGEEGRTTILVPMDYTGFLTEYPAFEQRSQTEQSVVCPDPYFLDCGGYYPDPVSELLAKFITDPKASITDEEMVHITAAIVFENALKAMGRGWYEMRRRMLPRAIGRSSIEELKYVIGLTVSLEQQQPSQEPGEWADVPDEIRRVLQSVSGGKTNTEEIVDFFAEKTGPLFEFDPNEA